jgi:hypothetical protein
MMPGALGRCDFGHVLMFGIVAFLLAPVSLEKVRKPLFLVALAILLVGFGILKQNYFRMGYLPRIARLIQYNGDVPRVQLLCDWAGLEKYGKIMTPLGTDDLTDWHLKETGKYVLDYYTGFDNLFTKAQLERKWAEMKSARVIMIPNKVPLPESTDFKRRFISRFFLCPFNRDARSPGFDPLDETLSYIRENYRLVEQLGDYYIMVPKSEDRPAGRQ